MSKILFVAILTCSVFAKAEIGSIELSDVQSPKEVVATNEGPQSKEELTCTCYGGPSGGDPFACAPIKTTCYGGPGYYPYPCTVCPTR